MVLAAIRLAEPINYTIIFPFINQMMEELHVSDKPSEIGFYSGLVDSCFAVAQCCTILQWGRLSDRLGRKPILYVGLSGSVISIFLFGLSKNLAWALTSRSIAGALSGNIAVIQSMLAEITDATNEAQAMPLLSVTWSAGCVLGPMLGGSLLHPAERWPTSPFNNFWFRTYPYALPCMVGASFGLCALLFAYTSLKETLVRRRLPHRASNCSTSSADTMVESIEPIRTTTTTRTILSHRPLRTVILSGCLNSVLATSYDVLFALMCFSPISIGGLSRSPIEIGLAFAFGGIVSVVMLPTTLPILQRRFGTSKFYNLLTMIWPITFLTFPLLNMLARRLSIGDDPSTISQHGTWALYIGIGILVLLSRVVCMTFSLNVMLVKAAAPNKEMLGSTYGVSQTLVCVARAIGPATASTLFALSVDQRLLGGNLVWYVLACIGVWSIRVSSQLRAMGL